MSATREDKVYYEGWHDGYKHAIDDIRQELLAIEAGVKAHVSIDSTEIYEMLNHMKAELEEAKNDRHTRII